MTRRSPRTQAGAALVVGLILLLLLTLIGLSAARTALTEERITGNLSDRELAFQLAEGALREAERLLQQPVLPPFNGNDGLYPPPDPALPPRWQTLDWDAAGSHRVYTGLEDAPEGLARAQARYFIEELPRVVTPGQSLAADIPLEDVNFYRVTARAVGIGGAATIVLQSTYQR